MPHNEITALSGVIRHVFAHRFTLEAGGRVHLADLGPKGLDAFPLAEGLSVELEGERRPSEIKVTRIAAPGRAAVDIAHKKPHHAPGEPNPEADAGPVLAALTAAGWSPRGAPRRKPKHFEVLARRGDGAWTEVHAELDGTVRKTKPADADKWAAALA